MKTSLCAPPTFEALTVVSPSYCGDESKNQDRACWHPATRVAGVADGVSTSPHSADAAALICTLSPVLFTGDWQQRAEAICAALVAQRLAAQHVPPRMAPETPEAMRPLLMEAARSQLESSHQAAFVAAGFTPADGSTLVELHACGDAAFFAYSLEGELLASYPDFAGMPAGDSPSPASDAMPFGPGDELMAKIVARLADRTELAEQVGVLAANAPKWLVCQPVDHAGNRLASPRAVESNIAWVTRGDSLIVPEYLIDSRYDRTPGGYCRVRFSRTIKWPARPASPPTFDGKGTVTAVLPDHGTTRWVHRQERFAADTQFVLCSDGLYEAFHNPGELWGWLREHEAVLADPAARQAVLQALHGKRCAVRGDDDISLVWVKGHNTTEAEEA